MVSSGFPYFFLAIALASVLHLSLVMRSHNFTSMSLAVPLKSWVLCWGMLGRRLWNWWKIDALKHSSFNDGDLSPSLISDPSVFSSFRYQAAAVSGLVLLVSSGRCWIRLSVVEWNCKWSDEALDVFFFIFYTVTLKAASSSPPTFGRFLLTSFVSLVMLSMHLVCSGSCFG